MQKVELSIIVPFYNEEENLQELNKKIVDVSSSLKVSCEVVYVNDGSLDKSIEVLEKAIKNQKSQPPTKIIVFNKNFGQTAAVSAGIDNSNGKLVSFLDSDLQNDPEDLPRFLEKLSEGYDAVFGWRKERRDATLRSFVSRVANKIINVVFSYPFHDVGCSARVVKKEYLKDIELYGELHRIMPVLIYLKGANIGEIVVLHHERKMGKSKYGFDRIVKTIIDIITVKFLTSYGTKPAYIFGTFGLGSFILTLITLTVVAYKKLFLGVYVHNDPLFLIAIFLAIVGVQFILMGLLAELQVRTYFESQNKRTYEVKKEIQY